MGREKTKFLSGDVVAAIIVLLRSTTADCRLPIHEKVPANAGTALSATIQIIVNKKQLSKNACGHCVYTGGYGDWPCGAHDAGAFFLPG